MNIQLTPFVETKLANAINCLIILNMLFKKNISVVTAVELSNSFHCLCALDLQKQLGVLNFTFLVKAFMLLLNCTQFIH